MSRRHLFVGMDEVAQARRSLIFTVIVVVFLSCATIAGSFVAGYEYRGIVEYKARKAKAEEPKRAQPAAFAPWVTCDRTRDLIEYSRACAARKRMTAVGAP